jgi:Zn-dependent M28 family amino/carboxypeptidase
MKKAAEILDAELRRMGHTVVERSFQLHGETFVNLEVEIPGSGSAREIVVVGAHYDTHRRSPGADDNASGCAVLLELARELRGQPSARTLRLVFFALGERPHLGTDEMGSRAWLRDAEKRGENVVAMLALDSLGVYYDAPSSQHYPFPLNFYYPDQGDFVGFLGNLSSRDMVHTCVRAFRETGRMPAEGLAAPGWVPGVKMSDHASFWRAGLPAVLVSDTMSWRNLNFHDPLDTGDYLDFERMARVVTGLLQVVRRLAMPAAA